MPPKHTANPWSFPPGTPVEISSNDDGFVGSWYVGRVLTANGNEYSVQYETLVSDLDPNEPLLETLKLSQLRQVPPRETLRDFRVGDQVDAFYKAGWWEGVVTDVLGNGRFGVFFRASKEQNEFEKEHLRQHRDWVRGKWVPPFEQEEVGIRFVFTQKRKKVKKRDLFWPMQQ